MRTNIFLTALGIAALVSLNQGIVGAETEKISVELKTFKFKVKEDQSSLFGLNEDEGKLFYYANGIAEATIKVPADGEYEVVVKASCDSAQNERAKFKVAIGGEAVGKETLLTADEAKEYKLTAKLKAGEHKLSVEFTNDVYKENEYDRNFYVHAVTLRKEK